MDCLFCKIINQEIPSYKIFEDDEFYAFLDIFPKNTGHSLLIPKKHTKDLLNSDDATFTKAVSVIKKINNLFENKLEAKGLTIITNNNLGQDVPHLHWHLIPRFKKENYTLPDTLKIDVEGIYKKLV